MTVRYHYDAHGNYSGSSESEGAAALRFLILLFGIPLLIGFGVPWLWRQIEQWYGTLGAPYRQLMGWYYVVFVVPAKFASWTASFAMNLTRWPNLNIVLTVLTFLFVFVGIYGAAFMVAKRTRNGPAIAMIALFGPAAVAIGWALVCAVARWLFA